MREIGVEFAQAVALGEGRGGLQGERRRARCECRADEFCARSTGECVFMAPP
jgi:hypothetical protein